MKRDRISRDLNDLPWHLLGDSAKDAIWDVTIMFAERFTGQIEIDCIEGGVREFREKCARRSVDLGGKELSISHNS